VTESAYMENPEIMERVVSQLQKAGFLILMDDFGSGYSSLNTLKDIHVDILKIDMKFLSGTADLQRSRSILASSILMAGWLDTPVIMEGVETAEQVEFLRSIGCNYVQGFFYAKPMPVSEYEALTGGAACSSTPLRSENRAPIRDVLWSSDPGNELLFNSLEEPAAVYEYAGGHVRVLRVNESFRRRFGQEYHIDERLGIERQDCLTPEDAQAISDTFAKAAETKESAGCTYRMEMQGGAFRQMRMALQYWGLNEKSAILFAQFFAAEPMQ